jgi:RNA polymerase sigma-70 factor (ECF subfamily)
MTVSDNQLMSRMCCGDMEALSAIVLRHQRGLVGFLTRLSGNRETAEDLAQETFLRVYQSSHRYRPVGRFTTWLYTIAYRLFIDAQRAWSSSRTAGLDGDHGLVEDRSAATPETTAIQSDLSRRVRQEIDALPEQYRPVLILRSQKELTYAEIAGVVGCSEGAARVRMHKGLALLRRRLKEAGLLNRTTEE